MCIDTTTHKILHPPPHCVILSTLSHTCADNAPTVLWMTIRATQGNMILKVTSTRPSLLNFLH